MESPEQKHTGRNIYILCQKVMVQEIQRAIIFLFLNQISKTLYQTNWLPICQKQFVKPVCQAFLEKDTYADLP